MENKPKNTTGQIQANEKDYSVLGRRIGLGIAVTISILFSFNKLLSGPYRGPHSMPPDAIAVGIISFVLAILIGPLIGKWNGWLISKNRS